MLFLKLKTVDDIEFTINFEQVAYFNLTTKESHKEPYVGLVYEKYEYQPVEVVTRYKRVDKS